MACRKSSMFSLLVIFAVTTLLCDAQTAPPIGSERLPGLDYVESGFDIVGFENGPYSLKLNAADKQYIYNTPRDTQVTKVGVRREVACEDVSTSFSQFYSSYFREESLYPFKINAGGNERVYKTPRDAQITKISLRREVNCEDLSNSFGQFYSNYFRSNQIPGGRPFFFFQMFNSYPETLKKIYESMTKEAKSVGTSTSWWGLYSIQLAPPFILKLDPFFNNTVTALASAPIPTNDNEQTLYNTVVQT
ncbi:unnamed protein product, partial [Rotaria sordida]